MFEEKDLPFVPGKNKLVQTPPEKMKEVGANSSAFAIHVNDVIEFPDKCHIYQQEMDNGNTVYYVGVVRNGRTSLVPTGVFTRRDVKGNYLDSLREQFASYPSFVDLYDNCLAGKKIKGTRMQDFEMAKFVDGNRVEGASQTRKFCLIEWA